MSKTRLIRTLLEPEVFEIYSKFCKDVGAPMSEVTRECIIGLLECEGYIDNSPPAEEKNSVEEEIDPRTGFRKGVRFNEKGFISGPETDAEKEYNRKALSASK